MAKLYVTEFTYQGLDHQSNIIAPPSNPLSRIRSW